MAQADLGKVRLTDAELLEKIIQANGGVKLGKDADGKPGYVVTDAETGADTVVPFSSSGGGFPIEGTICFAGAVICAVAGQASHIVCDLFKEPIEISEISEIKTITDIEGWYRTGSAQTSGLSRQMSVALILENASGQISQIYPVLVGSNNSTTSLIIKEKEDIVPMSAITPYKRLLGIGCMFYQYPGGSNSTNWFRSQIGYGYKPYNSQMKYIIS